ncbi:MAG: aspartate kinase [Sneathiella sp.]|uniref:aspartate kinase n=1 Tax=Sneathiella sp. TaxID=1964365 RepID=UPI000C61D62F|nr:aspartate kinase [Sneathiella sp.]MAZ02187.1 aspartate kinase [Sneathiella sp.]
MTRKMSEASAGDRAAKGEKAHTVHKIGGTSMSDIDVVFDNILIGNRKGDALYNRIFVVSAYGGITDMLLENKKTGEPGVFALYAGSENDWAWGDALSRVQSHMLELNADAFDDEADRKLADRFVQERVEGVRSCLIDLQRICGYGHFKLKEHLMTVREMISGIGEAHSAHNTMLLLRRKGVNAEFVDLSGWRESESMSLEDRIRDAFVDIDVKKVLPIVTGYTQAADGLMGIYGRGYSEVTFSAIACVTDAKEAVIHKEFHLSSADPRIVGTDKVRPIGQTNYDVADQLSNMGMEAIHPRAAKGLRQQGIPLRILNTFEPEHPGTVIDESWTPEEARVEIITGLENAFEVEIFDQDMVGIPGSGEIALTAFRRFKVPLVSWSMNANTMSFYVSAPMKQIRRVIENIQKHQPGADIQTRKVDIVSAIGANLRGKNLLGDAISAIESSDLELLASHVTGRGVDIQFAFPDGSYNQAVEILHKALIENANCKLVEAKRSAA